MAAVMCSTCLVLDAVVMAYQKDGDDTWPVCGKCSDQGKRLGAGVRYRKVDFEAWTQPEKETSKRSGRRSLPPDSSGKRLL